MLFNNVYEAIGNTPLIKIFKNLNSKNIYAKLEYCNPGGSIKDRSALYMLEAAEKNNLINSNTTIIEASSGNQAISLAMICNAKNYKLIIFTSKKISNEKLETLKSYGTKIFICEATKLLTDPNSYYMQALNFHKKKANSFFINQYFNLKNSEAHYNLLGSEIWNQTSGKITHYMAAAGSGGTVSGAGLYLKEKNSQLKVIAVDTKNSFRSTCGNPKTYKLEGIGVDFNSPNLNLNCIDEFITISDAEAKIQINYCAKNEGILIGHSAGAVAAAAKKYSAKLNQNDLMVIIFGDSGRAYLSKKI